jgi:hypothetical protein
MPTTEGMTPEEIVAEFSLPLEAVKDFARRAAHGSERHA